MGAYAFDGASYLSYPHLTAADGASKLTISLWLYPIASGGYSYVLGGVGNPSGGSGAGAGFSLQHYPGPDTVYLAFRGSGTERRKDGALATAAWNHVWIVYDGTQDHVTVPRVRTWINGTEITSWDVVGAAEPSTLGSHNEPFTLAFGEGWSGSFTTCRIADIGILFARAITDPLVISEVSGGRSIGHHVVDNDFWASFRFGPHDEAGGRVGTIVGTGATPTSGPSLIYPSSLSASLSSTTQLEANLATSIALAAGVAMESAAAPSLSTRIALRATGTAETVVAGQLSTRIPLQSAPAASSSVAVRLTTEIALRAALAADAALQANIGGAAGTWRASIEADAALSGALSTAIALHSHPTAAAAVTAELSTAIPLAATAATDAQLLGDLSFLEPGLSATLRADGALEASLRTAIPLSAAPTAAAATLTASLSTGVSLRAALLSESILTGTLPVATAPPTFAEFIAAASRELIVLAEITPSITLRNWTSAAPTYGNAYVIALPRLIQAERVPGGVYRQAVGVRINAEDLSPATSAAACNAIPGTWFWDELAELLYIRPSTAAHPDTFAAVQGFVSIHTATTGIVLDTIDGDPSSGRYYWPWLTGDLPSLTSQVEDALFGIKATPSGQVALINGHGFWHALVAAGSGYNWKNKRVRFYAGGRYDGRHLPRSEYAAVMTMLIDDITADEQVCTLHLKPLARQLDLEVPRTPFFESEYPHLGDNVRGTKKWLGYGRATIPPDLTDTTVAHGRWTVADAAYQNLFAVHAVQAVHRQTGQRVTLSHGTEYTVDLTACTVTILAEAYAHATHTIEVDVTGKHAAGVPIVRFGSIVRDLLQTYAGVSTTDLDLDAFAKADHDAPWDLSVWLKTPRSLSSIFSNADRELPSLERSVLGTVQQTLAGQWTCWIWDPGYKADNIVHLRKEDLALFTPDPKLETIYATTRVYYGRSHTHDGEWSVEQASDPALRYLVEIDEAAELFTFLAGAHQAQILAQRYQLISGAVSLEVEFRERGALLAQAAAGEKVLITYQPAPHVSGAFEAMPFEIIRLDKAYSPTLVISGRLGDLRGVGRTVGHWATSTAPRWTDASSGQRSATGFWSNSAGRIDPADITTTKQSRWW